MTSQKEWEQSQKVIGFDITLYEDEFTIAEHIAKLKTLGIPFVISPKHDKDLKEDGTLKKAHYHALLIYKNVMRLITVRNNIEYLLQGKEAYSRNLVYPIQNPYTYVEYLYHSQELNVGDKALYNFDDMQFYNCTYEDIKSKSKSVESGENLDVEIITYIMESSAKTFTELVIELVQNEEIELLKYCRKNSYYINTIMKELAQRQADNEQAEKVMKHDAYLAERQARIEKAKTIQKEHAEKYGN